MIEYEVGRLWSARLVLLFCIWHFVGSEADKELEIEGPESVLRPPIMGLPRISIENTI